MLPATSFGMGATLVKALEHQPQYLRMYLLHTVSRVLCYWLPCALFQALHIRGVGRRYKIQGPRKPSRELVNRDVRGGLNGELLGSFMTAFLFQRFLSARTIRGTVGASVGAVMGTLTGGGLGQLAGKAVGGALCESVGGQLGSAAGSALGAYTGASLSTVVDKLSRRTPAKQDSIDETQQRGWARLRIDGPAPTFITNCWQVLVAYAGYDAMFYWSHRLLHHPRFYRHCHKTHHEYHTPVSTAAPHQHIIEGLVQLFNWYVPIGFAGWLNRNGGGLHESTLFYYNCFRWLETVDAHCGYELPFSPFHLLPICQGARGHDYHHRAFDGCYGAMKLWDRLCGTDRSFLEELRTEGVLMAGKRVRV